jgi:hypothetical protein
VETDILRADLGHRPSREQLNEAFDGTLVTIHRRALDRE